MRRISKLSLLLAPILLASISGCATPSWMSRSEPTDPREARVNRLMTVAAEFEKEGKPEAAMRVYEHVLAQQPQHPDATLKRDLLAQQGVKSGARPLQKDAAPGINTAPQQMYASASKPKAPAEPAAQKDIAAEIHRKNAELAKMLAEQKASTHPIVAVPGEKSAQDNDLTPTPIPEQSLAAKSKANLLEMLNQPASVEDPGWASTGSSGDWQIVSNDIESKESAWKPTGQSQAAEEFASPTSVAFSESSPEFDKVQAPEAETSDWALVEADEPMPKSEQVASVSEPDADAWQTTDLTRPPAVEEKTVASEENWQTTRLAGLCDNLAPGLIPIVDRLESKESSDRVAALFELGELKSEARSASVAVYSLMQDQDPVVAVYAAGTLRQITGDAWSSVHTLTKYLDHTDPGIAQLSAYMLGQMGPEAMDAVPALERLRNNSQGMTSLHAAEALTHIAPADVSSVQKLTAALSETDRELRWFAAVSLGTVAGECEKQAAEALKNALNDGEMEVRIAACLSLGGLGSHAAIAIPDLEKAARSESPDVKSAAETALACLRG
ncbi:HEAT repeat domain-containing protein [Planctomicrobium sp. SH661]|uniref:HEAT repeat domain-containing protein n=1 Tax=Planctomicrobium sp. SH661 TaxID=3448124 RepID=UPI003F5B7B99